MYYYVINYWDEIDNEPRTDSGVTSASSFGEAAKKATEYYGIKNVLDVKLTELEQILSEEELMDIFNTENE